MQRNHTSLEHIALLLDNIPISATDDRELRMLRQNRVSRWMPIAKDRFRNRNDDTRLVFHRDENGRVNAAFLSSFPLAGMERLATIESPSLHWRLLGALVLVALAAVLGYGYRLLRPTPSNAALPRSRIWLGLGLGALVLAELGAIAYGLGHYTDEFSYGIPTLFTIVRWVGWLTTLLAAIAAAFAVLHFARANGRVGARVRYTIVAASGLLFSWQLWFWNLM
jgi:hypothetical protein